MLFNEEFIRKYLYIKKLRTIYIFPLVLSNTIEIGAVVSKVIQKLTIFSYKKHKHFNIQKHKQSVKVLTFIREHPNFVFYWNNLDATT